MVPRTVQYIHEKEMKQDGTYLQTVTMKSKYVSFIPLAYTYDMMNKLGQIELTG